MIPKFFIFLLSSLMILQSDLTAINSDTSHLSIIFAGDIMGHDSQIKGALYGDSGFYDYHFCFEYIKPFIEQSDISIANLEVTLGGPPYQGYPRFSSPDELAVALKESGFNILVRANNHALDGGKEGLERTGRILKQDNLIYTGTFELKEIRDLQYPLMIEKNNILIAILNFTYGTNGLIPSSPNVVNYIDTMIIRKDMEKVHAVNPDFIIAFVHWGNEYERDENKSQQELARYLLHLGVHAVIGSHPHVVQHIQVLQQSSDSSVSGLVVYSLGNFISNQRERYRDGGIIFGLELTKTEKTVISGFSYLPVWVQKPVVNGKTRFYLVPANIQSWEKEQLKFTEEDVLKLKQFYDDTHKHLENIPENLYFNTKPAKGFNNPDSFYEFGL